MSKLKSHTIIGLDEGCNSVDEDYYLKSDADKVIAEKDEKIEELEEHIDELQKATDSAWSKVNVYYDELRHHKYKRCLGIAAVCFEKSYSTTLVKYDKESGYRLNFYDWWGKRWLALAEKFKPNKSTAQ